MPTKKKIFFDDLIINTLGIETQYNKYNPYSKLFLSFDDHKN